MRGCGVINRYVTMSTMARRSQTLGTIGEQIARMTLERMHVRMVERIFTGWKLIRWTNASRGLAHIVAQSKVSGDFRGIIPGGRSVLVETKLTESDNRLRWSDLRPHQREALTKHSTVGGLSLVVWILAAGGIDADRDVFVLQWPIDGFAPYKPIDNESAKLRDIKYTRFK